MVKSKMKRHFYSFVNVLPFSNSHGIAILGALVPWCFAASLLFSNRWRSEPSELQTQQILNQVAFLAVCKSEVHAFVIVLDHRIQVREAAIVIKTSFEVS